MKLLEKILVPVALENSSNTHLDIAIKLAKTFKSQIIMIQVLPKEAKHESVNRYVLNQIKEDHEAFIKDLQLEGIKIKPIIEYGNLFDRIINIAEDEDVNLILFPSFIEQPGGKFNMDVTAGKLVRKSNKPIWMVREGDKAFPKSMLCTVDFSDASKRALNNAIMLARIFKNRLYILNIMKPMENNFSPRYSIDLEKENKRIARENDKLYEEFLAGFNFTDVDYETITEKGEPASEIMSFISRKNIDLLLMGATGKTFLQRVLLGSVTEKLIRELPSSIVITKAENILNLKIDSDISEIEKHISRAKQLEDSGSYKEAIYQLNLSIEKNDLHIPTLDALANLYAKIGDTEMSEMYKQKINEILSRLWDKTLASEIKKKLGY